MGGEMRPELSVDVTAARALEVFTDAEVRRVLVQIERTGLGPGGILQKHWQAVQDVKLSAKYMRSKAKRGQPNFVRTGAALGAMVNPASPERGRKISPAKRRLSVYLRKMVEGVNVYDQAQRGRLAGLENATTGESMGAEAARSLSHERSQEYLRAAEGGYRGTYTQYHGRGGGGRAARGASGGKRGLWRRIGRNEMPIARNMDGDDEELAPVVEAAVIDVLRRKGLL